MMIAYVPAGPGAAPVPHSMPAPELGPGELLVEIEAAVVAAPERALFDGSGRFAPGEAAVGVVVAAGAAAGDALGQRMVVGPVRACAECDVCRRGHPAVCPNRSQFGIDCHGTVASHVVVPRRWATALAGPLAGVAPGPTAALLGREAALAYEMIVRAGLAPGETTVWVGGGPIATLGMALARAKGATAYADHDAPPSSWRIFETSGQDAGRARAAGLAAAGATVVLAPGIGIVPSELWNREVTVVGVAGPHPDLVPELCALVARGELALDAAARLAPLDALPSVLAELRSGAAERTTIVTRG